MPSLLDIRRRIRSVKNTQKITKAIKMVAASRLRKASEMAVAARPYVEGLERVHSSVTSRIEQVDNPLYQPQNGKTLFVVFSSDKGLCGSFNANVLKAGKRKISEMGKDKAVILPIGKKATSFFKRFDLEMIQGYSDVYRELNSTSAQPIAKRLVDEYGSGKYSEIVLLYNKFKNVLVQEVTFQPLLPLKAESAQTEGVEHLAEPSLDQILEEMAPNLILTKVFQAMMESNAAEQAAKMTAMDAATSNAADMIEKLTLDMNKVRQAAITKELIEIVSGAAAL